MSEVDDTSRLAALWRSQQPRIDADRLIAAVYREARLQRRFVNGYYALAGITLVYIAWLDLAGVFLWPGVLTATVAGSMIWQWLKVRRARRRCPDAASMSPEELLDHALRHARATLRTARIMHSALPASIVAGFLAAPLLIDGDPDVGGPNWVHRVFVVVVLAVVAGLVSAGLLVASRKKREIAELHRRRAQFRDWS